MIPYCNNSSSTNVVWDEFCVLTIYHSSILIELDSLTPGTASKAVGHIQALKYKQNSVF